MLAPWQLDSRVRRHFLPRNSIWQINEYQIDRPLSVSCFLQTFWQERLQCFFFQLQCMDFFFILSTFGILLLDIRDRLASR